MNSLIIAFTPNPYLALHFYDTLPNFIDDIDEMIIGIDGEDTPFNIKVKNFIYNLFESEKITNCIYRGPMDQGQVFDRLYKHCQGDILITMDSDLIIKKKGYLEKWIKVIESGNIDLIGSTGGHIDKGLREAVFSNIRIGGPDNVPIGRINPFLSFWRMSILKQIKDLTFAGKDLKEGDMLFPKAGIKAPADGYVDPFVLAFLGFTEHTEKILITKDEDPPDCFHYGGLSWIYRSYLVNTKKKITPDGTKLARNNMRLYHFAGEVALFDYYKDRFPHQDYNDFVAETIGQHKELCEKQGHKQTLEHYINVWNEIIKL